MFDETITTTVHKDDRNRKLDNGHEPKQRENFIEEMERNAKKADRLHSQNEELQKKLDNLPSDDEDLTKEQKHKKTDLEHKLSHNTRHEHRLQHSTEGFEHRTAHTNIKISQHQVKQGKHRNAGEFGMKGETEDPMA